MKQRTHIRVLILSLLISITTYAYRVPRLTVIFVIDQLAHHHIPKLKHNFKGGMRFLLKHGVVYENAYFPHAVPSTAPGHAGLNTGAYPQAHGIIGNSWFNRAGKKITFEDCSNSCEAILNPNGGTYECSISAKNIMVDGISDQFMFSKRPGMPRYAYSIGLKSRATVATANKMGKAIWLDEKSGNFTSSKAYFDEVPEWVQAFNRSSGVDTMTSVYWKPMYPLSSIKYRFKYANSYRFSSDKSSLLEKEIPIDRNEANPYELFACTPHANQLVLDLAERCIEEHLNRRCDEEMLLWVCLGSLDKVGHKFGPQSKESIDTIYRLDCQLEAFMHNITKRIKRSETVYVLTADHGVSPIPERLQKEGYYPAGRIMEQRIIPEMNQLVLEQFGIDGLIRGIHTMQIYFDMDVFEALPQEKQDAISQTLITYLMNQKGIKHVWTPHELKTSWFLPDQIESYFKTQYYPGRSGQLIVQPEPYNSITKYKRGTCHRTPYEADTHVPLIIYQKAHIEQRVIYDKVWALQLANTLAFVLNVQKPSASAFSMLPGIIDYDPITGEVIQPIVR